MQKVSHWNDPYELRVDNWIEPWDFGSDLDVGLITVPSSKTSIKHNGAFAAPNALRNARYLHTTYSPDYDVDIQTFRVRDMGDIRMPILDPIQEVLANIQESLYAAAPAPAKAVHRRHRRRPCGHRAVLQGLSARPTRTCASG